MGRQHFAPICDQLLIGLANRSGIPVEIEQAKRVDRPIVLAKRGVPVDLVRQRIPSKADDRNPVVAYAKNVRPFLLQPPDGFITIWSLLQVGLAQ